MVNGAFDHFVGRLFVAFRSAVNKVTSAVNCSLEAHVLFHAEREMAVIVV